MRLAALVCLVVLILAYVPCAALAQSDDTGMTVVAEGSAAVIGGDVGKAEDEAISDAKRNAVEQAVGVFVKSETMGRDYQVVESTILTRSEGFISTWEKVEGSRKTEKVEGDTLLSIKVKATVKMLNLVNAMSDSEAIYEAMQRPRIMVLISENNMGSKPDGLPTTSQAVMRYLQDHRFDVVDPDVTAQVVAKEAARAVIERGDAKAAGALAQDQGAEILVLGTAKSSKQDMGGDYGDAVKTASATVSVRLVYADTGEVLYTSPQTQGRGLSSSDTSDAGLQALDKAGEALLGKDSSRFASLVLARWASEVQNGRVFRLIANGVEYSQVSAIKKALQDFRGFKGFVGQSSYRGKTATINVKVKLSPDEFRDRLEKMKIGKKKVNIDLVSGTVTAMTLK